MVLDPIPQPLLVHFFGSRPQPPTSPLYIAFVEFFLSRLKRCVCVCVYVCIYTHTLQYSLAVFSRVTSLFFFLLKRNATLLGLFRRCCSVFCATHKTATYHCDTHRNATLLALFYKCCLLGSFAGVAVYFVTKLQHITAIHTEMRLYEGFFTGVAVFCSVLQCLAVMCCSFVCCSVLQCVCMVEMLY